VRTSFLKTLTELAASDPLVTLIVGDLGFSVIEEFAQTFPNQFVNAGVAEQNMTGLAAGMALSGRVVFTYSIGNFPVLRCLEQIRNDVCYHQANVKIVCVGGGLSYGNLGFSHHATEDLAIMRALPGMVVLAPGDPVEAECATRALASYEGPAYLRLGRAGEPAVHTDRPDFRLGRAIVVRSGTEITLISTGAMLPSTCLLADRLTERGLSVRVLSMHTLQPLDQAAVVRAATETRLVVTLEEHSIKGGLGGAVAEVMAELPKSSAVLKRLGLRRDFSPEVGDQRHLQHIHGIDVDGLERDLNPVLIGALPFVG